MKLLQFLCVSILTFTIYQASGQSSTCIENPVGSGNWFQPDGVTPCANAISTVVPFLRVVPDARASGMGNIGLATSNDPNSMHFNASKYVASDQNGGIAISYVPWLKNLGLQDIYLAYLSGYLKLDKFNAIAGSIRYFNIGKFQFVDGDGDPIGIGQPNEFEVAVSYSRKLGDKVFAGLTGKYIYSNLATGVTLAEEQIVSGKAGAVDLSFLYKTPLQTKQKSDFSLGVAITNIGSNIQYRKNTSFKDHLPANLGIGFAYDIHLDDYNRVSFGLDINKLLVPTPELDTARLDVSPSDGVPDYRQKSLFPSIFQSFNDSPQGFSDEIREISFGAGAEYWYNDAFSLRLGYAYENPRKGNQRFFTLGLGIKYTTLGINLSYIVPTTNQTNVLDNTLRFTLLFDFGMFESDQTE